MFLDYARQYIGLIRGQQMAVFPVPIGKHRGIIHPGLILQRHKLHGLTFLGGDNLLREEPPYKGDFFSHILSQILCKNALGTSKRFFGQIERVAVERKTEEGKLMMQLLLG